MIIKLKFDWISIHVPSRGTTAQIWGQLQVLWISIHVPSRGTTGKDASVPFRKIFQSTYPQGVRHQWRALTGATMNFNPRTLKGYDRTNLKFSGGKLYFNPRTLKGYDIASFHLFSYSKRFQSTYPQGVRLVSQSLSTGPKNFNPRTLKGYDFYCPRLCTTWDWFQSTYPQGVRRYGRYNPQSKLSISIHVPSRGTTLYIFLTSTCSSNFNPRTLKGYDKSFEKAYMQFNNFNPRTLKGYDQIIWWINSFKKDFNPRTLKGYDAMEIGMAMAKKKISIHVPSRGTTNEEEEAENNISDFNPRTLKGYDRNWISDLPIGKDFNPRTLKGYDG